MAGPDSLRAVRTKTALTTDDGTARDRPNAGSGLLHQNRNFLRLFAAGIASVGGSAIAQLCLIWIIVTDTGSS
ncbi:MAG: hypothetical protein WAN87_03450, partial [Thermoplasmata archaeon]